MPLDLPRVAIDADYWSLRFVDQTATTCAVRKNVRCRSSAPATAA
jgi:hypothetical protein